MRRAPVPAAGPPRRCEPRRARRTRASGPVDGPLPDSMGQATARRLQARRPRPRAQRHRCPAAASPPGAGRPHRRPATIDVAEVGAERIQQRVAPRLVQATHPAQVPLEVALADEVGEHLLIERRRLAVGQPLGRDERLDQARRQHHEPDPQRREERLREAARRRPRPRGCRAPGATPAAGPSTGSRSRSRPRRSARPVGPPTPAGAGGAAGSSSRRSGTGARA